MPLGGGPRQRIGVLAEHLGGDLGDVGPRVPVLRRRLTLRRGQQGADEAVDLRATVVEVVLAGDLCTLGGEDAAERIANGGPAGVAEVQRAGGVGRDELEVDPGADHRGAVAVPVAVGQHGRDHRTSGRGGEPHVEEAGPGHLDGVHPVGRGQRRRQPASQLARVHPDRLGHLQGEVRRVVAVLGVAGPLDHHQPGQHARVQAALIQHPGGGGTDQEREVVGSHRH